MELVLSRTYYPTGTNGTLHLNGKTLCFTIELPWRDNKPRVSCIPEGRYLLARRFSDRHKHHLEVKAVNNRDLILIHPANHALDELKGCIAPVSMLTGPGRGNNSRTVFNPLLKLAYGAQAVGEEVWLTIIKNNCEPVNQSTCKQTN